nr:DUF3892 domain-containing protein [Maliibacterium massiliense]
MDPTYATKIRMTRGCAHSDSLLEIEDVYLANGVGEGYFSKEMVYDYLVENAGAVRVNIPPYPKLVPATSKYGEKYVRSRPNASGKDNLLCLPRE